MTPRTNIVLHDVHEVPSPPLWPLAPGWWILIALTLTLALAFFAWRRHARQKRERANALFDAALAEAKTPAQRLQVMSELLRRAARRVRTDADTLSGEAWLDFLDEGMPHQTFGKAPGSLIEAGLYVPDVAAEQIAEIEPAVRARFLLWMGAR